MRLFENGKALIARAAGLVGHAAAVAAGPWRFGVQARRNPVAPLLADRGAEHWGLFKDWAPADYGEYAGTSPTVYACVSLRARNLARVDVHVHQLQPNGETVPLPNTHPAQRLLDRPNPHWSRYRFWYMVEACLCLYGSAPVAVFRDESGTPAELWVLHPSHFKVVPHRTDYIKGYLYRPAGQDIAFKPEEIVWFRYPNPMEEYAGLSPIAALKTSIDTTVDAIRFNRRFFENDATPGRVVVAAKGTLNDSEAAALQNSWEKAFKGRDNAHRVAVMGNDVELKTVGLSQRDMEFINGQIFTREQIASAFGISPILLGDLRFSSLNNSQIAKSMFWDETMTPEITLVESELDLALLPAFGRDLVARFDVTEIGSLREDAQKKAERERILVETGLRTINELRDEDGYDPVPWGQGPGPGPIKGKASNDA